MSPVIYLIELTSLEVKIKEEEKVLLWYDLLPSSSDNIVTTILFKKETLKFNEVIVTLCMNETR